MNLCERLLSLVAWFGSGAKDDKDFDNLNDEARPRTDAHTPKWSDRSDSDPGVTLLELLAFLLLTIVYFGAVAKLVRALAVPERIKWAVTVADGWSRVEDLPVSGPDDRHYTVDPTTGTVRFGDGVHGARPPTQPVNIASRYRVGGGAAGAVGVATLVWAGLAIVWCRFRGHRTT